MTGQRTYPRFPLIRRMEHWVMVAAFVTLALTGLPQKYPTAAASLAVFRALGGIETARAIHHVAAVVLILISLVHVGSVAYDLWVLGKRPSIWFTRRDLTNAWQSLLYNLGLRRDRPQQGWYTFEEKVEYWALVWGILVMVVTGFFLWNPILVSNVLPGDWIPAAKIAHGSEAVLAVLAILIWHTYHVHLKHFNRSMFTGSLTLQEMEEEHPLYLRQGPDPWRVPEPQRKVRRRWFWLGYGLFALLALAGIYGFVTAEVTAVAEPPPLSELATPPATSPPTPTPLPPYLEVSTSETITWAQIAPLLQQRCGFCHVPRHGFGGLDLTTRAGIEQGGAHGPVVRPGEPGRSPLWFWPQRRDHPVAWSAAEAQQIWAWIAQGAP